MSGRLQTGSLTLLRWVVGLVVLWESLRFAISPSSAHHLARLGLPRWVAFVLGGAEIVAAVLFLVPKMSRVGGFFLLLIFLFASVLHVLHGEYQIGPLLVYAAAVLACLSAKS